MKLRASKNCFFCRSFVQSIESEGGAQSVRDAYEAKLSQQGLHADKDHTASCQSEGEEERTKRGLRYKTLQQYTSARPERPNSLRSILLLGHETKKTGMVANAHDAQPSLLSTQLYTPEYNVTRPCPPPYLYHRTNLALRSGKHLSFARLPHGRAAFIHAKRSIVTPLDLFVLRGDTLFLSRRFWHEARTSSGEIWNADARRATLLQRKRHPYQQLQ